MRRIFRPWWKGFIFLAIVFVIFVEIFRVHYFATRLDYPEKWNLVQIGMTPSEVNSLDLGIDPNDTRETKGQDFVRASVDGEL